MQAELSRREKVANIMPYLDSRYWYLHGSKKEVVVNDLFTTSVNDR